MRLLFVLAALFAAPVIAAPLPPGPFSEVECIACHTKETPDIVKAWNSGPHGTARPVAGCSACHGVIHANSAARSRQSSACVDCHGGNDAPIVRSYQTSKHGVIATIEHDRYDFTRPLSGANYRAPTCAYCHLHDGAHGANTGPEDACYDCHSPRYVTTLIDAGNRGLDIGRLKIREAEDAIADWQKTKERPQDTTADLHAKLTTMRNGPFANLRLGTVHSSPDFQWWYGQAALDGDLLRIKAALSRLMRKEALE